ncbi:MAG: tetratricopeptide repeat protein [Planctomycetes bacterium]|nr:tetratricopeptide repeat protein [Planctomycetota bacterium]
MARESASIREQEPRIWVWALPVFAAGIALVFGPSWAAPTFLAREDSILRLPLLSHWRNLPIIFSQDFMLYSDGMYRPFSYSLIALLRTIVPTGALGLWHAMLIGLHALNSWMVFLLVRHFAKRTGVSLLAAGVFCFHPLASVLVNNINHFHLLLGVGFYLGTALLYLAFRDSHRILYFAIAIVTFALGLLTSTIVITLPLFLIAYELIYQRFRQPRMMLPIAGLFILAVSAIVLWAKMGPPPLLYSYPVEPEEAVPSFLSLIAGTKWYALGLLFGWQVPVVLRDAVPLVSSWGDPRFLCWAGAIALVLAASFWRMARRDPIGLGLFLIFAMMIPFATTAWNPVEEHGSWVFLYGSAVGLAVAAGGLAKHALSIRRTWFRWAAVGVLILLLLHNGILLSRINRVARSPLTYWRYVLTLNGRSKTAQVELGKAYLAAGEPEKAVQNLFTPDVDFLEESCRAMCRYYLRNGDLWPASIHAMFAKDDFTLANLWEALNCLDHAECNLGLALARNPYDTRVMKRLAGVFIKKGFVPDAREMLDRVLTIDPSDGEALSMTATIEANNRRAYTAAPPTGDWVRFLANRTFSDALHRRTLACSEALPDDPVLQMISIGCLLERKHIQEAVRKFMNAYCRLSALPNLGVQLAWYLTQTGRPKAGEAIAREVLGRHPDNARMQSVLGVALAKQGRFEEALSPLAEALRLNPNTAATHYHMGWALANLDRPDEAVNYFRRAVQINPDLVKAHLGLAKAYTALGRDALAAKHIGEAIRAKQNDPQAHREWAVANFLKGDYTTAWKHVRECQRLGGWLHPDFLRELRAKMPPPSR